MAFRVIFTETSFVEISKETIEKMSEITSNFERLVLGCMDSYDSNQILILHFFLNRVLRDLQDLQSFAPLRSQNFNRNSANFFQKFA